MEWCEHCQGHYPTSHYDADALHQAGHEYGPYGALLAAEEIVLALANCDAPEGDHGGCALCSGYWPADAPFEDMAWHEPSCPWRRAREWVAHHADAASTVTDDPLEPSAK